MLENPLVIRRLREILQQSPSGDQATMVFQTPTAGIAAPHSEDSQQLKAKIDRLSKALEQSREEILRLQEENDTLRGTVGTGKSLYSGVFAEQFFDAAL